MYIPRRYEEEKDQEKISMVHRENSFAIVHFHPEGTPHGTHIPRQWKGMRNGNDACRSYLRGNEQKSRWAPEPGARISPGPHAYVSPLVYEMKGSHLELHLRPHFTGIPFFLFLPFQPLTIMKGEELRAEVFQACCRDT